MRETEDPIDLFLRVCELPGMYVSSGRFEAVWSFIDGFDTARDKIPLRGFSQWLCVRRGEYRNSTWYQQIVEDVLPYLNRPDTTIPESMHERLRNRTAVPLSEFRKLRDSGGVESVLDRYKKLGGLAPYMASS